MQLNREKSVRVRISGGIGNQLFMYIAGVALSKHLGVDLEIYRKCNDKAERIHSGSLTEFCIFPISDQNKIENLSEKMFAKFQRKLTRDLHIKNKLILKWIRYFESDDTGFDSRIYDLTPGVEIRGYFQTYRYFDECLKYITPNQLISLRSPSKAFLACSEDFESTEICGIHIRRGDYLLHQNSIGLLGVKYYENAIKKVLEYRKVNRFAVFSDDAQEAYNLLSPLLPKDTIWPRELDMLSSSENLILMSKAHCLVIANSSFSLLAALLAGEESLIIRPDKWFVGQSEPIDLCKPTWIKVPSFESTQGGMN